MSDVPHEGKLHIDSDWKQEAQREKDRLAKEEARAAAAGPLPEPSFLEIINVIAMQAVIGLGGLAGPGGERIPADPHVAKHHIDMLEVLARKTEGHLTPEETQVLQSVIYELRMRFVEAFSSQPPPSSEAKTPE